MWIITSDRIHEAGINPAGNVPKSRDYMSQATRKKAACRKHVFRLTKSGRELFRGVAYFEKDATFKEILRPLDEFGRAMYDCDGIEYMLKDLSMAPTGRQVWNKVPEELGRDFDGFAEGEACIYKNLFDIARIDDVTEATVDMLERYLRH